MTAPPKQRNSVARDGRDMKADAAICDSDCPTMEPRQSPHNIRACKRFKNFSPVVRYLEGPCILKLPIGHWAIVGSDVCQRFNYLFMETSASGFKNGVDGANDAGILNNRLCREGTGDIYDN